jgi:hypothetical protein
MKYFKPFKENFSSEEYYEKVYPVSVCIFAPLGILMACLMIVLIMALLLDFNFQIIPIFLFLGYP